MLDAAALVTLRANPLVRAALYGASAAFHERLGKQRIPADARYTADWVNVAPAAANDAEFDASYQHGLKLSAGEALAMVERFVQAEVRR